MISFIPLPRWRFLPLLAKRDSFKVNEQPLSFIQNEGDIVFVPNGWYVLISWATVFIVRVFILFYVAYEMFIH